MEPAPRVLLADADAATRSALSLLFRNLLGVHEIGQAPDGETLSRLLADGPPSLLLLDWSLPGRPDAAALQALEKGHPHLRLVILSVDGAVGEQARSLGAAFISKGSAAEHVLEQLRALLDGATCQTKP